MPICGTVLYVSCILLWKWGATFHFLTMSGFLLVVSNVVSVLMTLWKCTSICSMHCIIIILLYMIYIYQYVRWYNYMDFATDEPYVLIQWKKCSEYMSCYNNFVVDFQCSCITWVGPNFSSCIHPEFACRQYLINIHWRVRATAAMWLWCHQQRRRPIARACRWGGGRVNTRGYLWREASQTTYQ